MSRSLRPGPASIRGLDWLARVGPAPLEPWRYAMGWSEVAARSHARRLEREGWLERYPMTRGHGSLFVATRRGVQVADVAVRAAGEPAPTSWAHLSACAWMAAWLTARGRGVVGSRELLADRTWQGKIGWSDHKGFHTAGHRPDLLIFRDDLSGVAAVEVELAQKSIARLEAILRLHARWWRDDRTIGVVYICGDEDGRKRVRKVAPRVGLGEDPAEGLRIELLASIKAQTIAASRSGREGASQATSASEQTGTRVARQLALFGER